MKKSILFSFAVLTSFSVQASTLIDDGIQASANAFPAIVKLTKFSVSENVEVPISHCTGTMIASDLVLTAAHCVNRDSKIIQRVSLPGNSEGLTKDGVKVKTFFLGKDYEVSASFFNKLSTQYSIGDYLRLSVAEREAYKEKLIEYASYMSQFDFAFLELEKDQRPSGKLPALACRKSLTPGSEVTIAGYGYNLMTGARQIQTSGILNYGSNTIEDSESIGQLYQLKRKAGRQLINSGDSGGPLMSKESLEFVYGVASTKLEDKEKRNIMSTFSNLSSTSARGVYLDILAQREIPKSLERILRGCL